MENAWKAFVAKNPDTYLRSEESREQNARFKVVSLLQATFERIQNDEGKRALRVLELGSGNGERLDLVLDLGIEVEWTGVDISTTLVDSAKRRHPNHNWFVGDAEQPESVLGDLAKINFDICLLCHVLEIIESPELALTKAKELAKSTIVEFFEPPSGLTHRTEIRFFPESHLPYLRHKIGKETYLTWLRNAGFSDLRINQTFGKYEVHELH